MVFDRMFGLSQRQGHTGDSILNELNVCLSVFSYSMLGYKLCSCKCMYCIVV